MSHHFHSHTYSLFQTFQLSLNYIVYKKVLRNDQVKLENKVAYYLYDSSKSTGATDALVMLEENCVTNELQPELKKSHVEETDKKSILKETSATNHPQVANESMMLLSGSDSTEGVSVKQNNVMEHQASLKKMQDIEVVPNNTDVKENKDVIDQYIREISNRMVSNVHNLPNALLIEVQHSEISMDSDVWFDLLDEHVKHCGGSKFSNLYSNIQSHQNQDQMTQRNDLQHSRNNTSVEDPMDTNDDHDTSVNMKSVTRSNSKYITKSVPHRSTSKRKKTNPNSKKRTSLEKIHNVFRIDQPLKANDTIHNHIVRQTQSNYRNILFSSLEFVVEFYSAIIVVIDSRVVNIEKIIQWLLIAKRFHNKLRIWTVIEVKRHDMLFNALPDALIEDFQFELMKKSPSKREVFFILLTYCNIDQHRDIPFKLSFELFESLLDTCTLKNDDINYFITYMTSVMEMMVSTQPPSVLMYYAKFNYDDPSKFAGELDLVLSGVTIDEWRYIANLPSVKDNQDFMSAYASYINDNTDSVSRKSIEDFLKNGMHTLLTVEEFNVIMLDCFLAVWRAVRGYKTLHDPEIYNRSLKYTTQRIILYRDFLKHTKFMKTKMMRAVKQFLEDAGFTFKMYKEILKCFQGLFSRHSELEGCMKENMNIVETELLKEFNFKVNDMISINSQNHGNCMSGITPQSYSEFENVRFSSPCFLELLQNLDDNWVHHYTELSLWELYYADGIDSQKRLQENFMDGSILTMEDWMNTTMAHNHRIQLLYAHHSVDSELSKVFKGMRIGGTNENAQYEAYLQESKHEDNIETQRQWYKWMKTVKRSGLR